MIVIIRKLSSIRNSFALLWVYSMLNMITLLSLFWKDERNVSRGVLVKALIDRPHKIGLKDWKWMMRKSYLSKFKLRQNGFFEAHDSLYPTHSCHSQATKNPLESGLENYKYWLTYADSIGSEFCFLRPNIKNKQPNKNPTLGAREPSISGAPTVYEA